MNLIQSLLVKEMNQKLKFLGLAIFLAFGAMGIGQYLLYRESTDSIIFHCREINKQHISFHNLISSLAVIPSKVANNKFRSPSYCKKYMKKEYAMSIADLENRSSFNINESVQVKGEIMRFKADNFQEVMRSRGEVTENLLLAALGMNVAGLATMSLFLKFDSEDMD